MNIKVKNTNETTYDIPLDEFANAFSIRETITDVCLMYPAHADGDSITFDDTFVRISTKHINCSDKQI